ncbi:hypothetical protein [Actinoplanes couchii]|uniref:Lipoprotein n=1 Tax=Actinoplanes couchii TaxID=403638 RepID=A0ABQ3WZD4_9ACTN|nr:hypothetical protein [Actinoplanes couchii]MDR6316023.1 hypothetical protein [Actinoplanes couchii]GID51636.1 hypothetical protein Aco03nite_000400 [Actinoplanes couchii]
MRHGERNNTIGRRGLFIGALAALAGTTALAGCSTEPADTPAAGTSSAAVTMQHLGLDGYGKLRITMTRSEALATGDLITSPVSTVGDSDDYSFLGGPAPDPSRMAADEKLEKDVEKAEKAADAARAKAEKYRSTHGRSAEESATSAQLSADSAKASMKSIEATTASIERMGERLTAFLNAGGVSFTGDVMTTIAAPPKATTAEGVARGSSLEQLKTAYDGKGLKSTSEGRYELPAAQPGWTLTFDVEADKVAYMMLRATRN